MSDIGLIVILAVLILGGLIATIGDRLGSKVGKARLSLFNLRPKQTATIVTIVTGTLISASTFGVLFVSSRQFRDMLTQFDRIRDELKDRTKQLNRTVEDLSKTNQQKAQVEDELDRTRNERKLAESQLKRINQSLKQSIEKQRQTNAQLQRAEAQRDVIKSQLNDVSGKAEVLQTEIAQLEADRDRIEADRNRLQIDRQSLIAQRDQVRSQIAERDSQIAERTKLLQQRDRDIAQRDQVIAQRAIKLQQLQEQQAQLAEAVQQSEAEARQIRDGFLAILRNQVLSSAVFRVVNPNDARLAIEELLRQANRVALQSIQPGASENTQIVGITPNEVEQIIRQVSDGRDYVVKIFARANYVRGEQRPVIVSAFVAFNQRIFGAGDIIASGTLEPAKLNDEEFRRNINQLIASSNLRARRAGVLSDDTVQLPEPRSYAAFLEQLRQYQAPVELRIVAADETYTAGPLKVELIAVQNGKVILKTAARFGNQG